MSDSITDAERRPLRFDAGDPALQEDPYPAFARLRDEAPLHHDADGGVWLLSRYADVAAVLRDAEAFSNGTGAGSDPALDLIGRGDLLNLDPPRHDELRRIVRGAFAPAAVAALEPAVRATVRALVEPLAERGRGDLAAELAWPLPVATILSVLGLPAADAPHVTALVRRLDGPDGQAALGTLAELRAYVDDAAARPRDGVIGQIARARADGRLDAAEVGGLVTGLVLAGTATVACLVSNGLLVLQRHPGQLALLREAATVPAPAIEELLRFESPVQTLPRRTTRAVGLHGREVPEGETLLLLLGSANRDPRRFERPDELDLRRPHVRHAALGGGIHFCIGAALARLEARIALEELLARVRGYEPDGAPVRIPSGDVRGLLSLPVTVEPR